MDTPTDEFKNKDHLKESKKMMELLRRTYDAIEECHLNDHKCVTNYVGMIRFPRQLGDDIFNYLSGNDQTFREIVIRRQKRYRKRMKAEFKRKENEGAK